MLDYYTCTYTYMYTYERSVVMVLSWCGVFVHRATVDAGRSTAHQTDGTRHGNSRENAGHFRLPYAMRAAPVQIKLDQTSLWPTNQRQAFSVAMWMRLEPRQKVASPDDIYAHTRRARSGSRRPDVTSPAHHPCMFTSNCGMYMYVLAC